MRPILSRSDLAVDFEKDEIERIKKTFSFHKGAFVSGSIESEIYNNAAQNLADLAFAVGNLEKDRSKKSVQREIGEAISALVDATPTDTLIRVTPKISPDPQEFGGINVFLERQSRERGHLDKLFRAAAKDVCVKISRQKRRLSDAITGGYVQELDGEFVQAGSSAEGPIHSLRELNQLYREKDSGHDR